jgi:recombination protein RecT
VLGNAPAAIAHLKAHRLKREAKVLAAMRAKPGASVEELVPLAYDDVDERLWPVAARSLLAHVRRLDGLTQS